MRNCVKEIIQHILAFAVLVLIPVYSLASSLSMVEAADAPTYLMIGDSRFVGMQTAVGGSDNVYWIDRVGAGSDLYFEYQDLIQTCDRNAVIIYNLGINDLDAGKAITAINALTSLGFQHVWFSTVGPVNEELGAAYGYTITNEDIIQFNQQVANNVPPPVGVVDSFYYLWYNNFNTLDGIHYDDATYEMWYQYLLSSTF